MAFSTPFQMFKRYSQYSGGTCDPLVISWPKGIKAKGEVRHQYHHSTDIVPTILDVCGLEMPKVYRGVEQWPLSGVSMRYSVRRRHGADGEEAAVLHDARHARHLGERLEGVGDPRTAEGKGHFDKDQWELYHVDEDRAEARDLAKMHPERLDALVKVWFEEAEKNSVLMLDAQLGRV